MTFPLTATTLEPAKQETDVASKDAETHYQAMAHALKQLGQSLGPGASDDPSTRIRNVQAAVRTMREVLMHHQALTEEEGGKTPEATSHKPALIPESERLVAQHADMLRRADELDREVELQLAFEEFDAELIHLEALVLRDLVRAHLWRANSLAYEAYFRVEGGEGG